MASQGFLRATRAAIRTTTGTQDFTVSGVGTPKGAIVYISRGTSDGTITATMSFSVGFTDGTNQRVLAAQSEDNVADSNTSKIFLNDNVIALINSAGTAVGVVASFSSFITDGVRLNFTVVDAVAYLCTVVLICGDGSSVYVGDADMPNNAGLPGSTADFTSAGFEADFGLFMGAGLDPAAYTSQAPTANMNFSLAQVANISGSVEAGMYAFGFRDVIATANAVCDTDVSGIIYETVRDSAATPLTLGTPCSFTAWLSNGFRLTDINGTNPTTIGYILVDLGGPAVDTAVLNSPTSVSGTATASFTNGDSAFFLATSADATGSKADGQANGASFGFASQSEQFSIGYFEQDNVATMNNGCISDNAAISAPTNLGSGMGVVATAAFSTTQLTTTFSTVYGTARKQMVLLIARPVFSGTSAMTGPSPSSAGVGKEVFRGTSAMTGPHPATAGVGKEVFKGTSTPTGPHPATAATGLEVFRGSATLLGPHPTSLGTGLEVFRATAALIGPSPATSAAALLVFRGSAVLDGPHPTCAGLGALAYVAQGALEGPHPSCTGAGLLVFRGSSALTGPSPVISGTGTMVPVSYVGAGALIGPSPLISGAGLLVFRCAGDVIGPHPLCSGSDDVAAPIGCTHDMEGSWDEIVDLDGSYASAVTLDGSYDAVKDLRGSNC